MFYSDPNYYASANAYGLLPCAHLGLLPPARWLLLGGWPTLPRWDLHSLEWTTLLRAAHPNYSNY